MVCILNKPFKENFKAFFHADSCLFPCSSYFCRLIRYLNLEYLEHQKHFVNKPRSNKFGCCKNSCSKTLCSIHHYLVCVALVQNSPSCLPVYSPHCYYSNIVGWPGKIQVISRSLTTKPWGPQPTSHSPSQGQVHPSLYQTQPGVMPCQWMMTQSISQ